jgi:adenosylhomocysteine nucleosidase
MHDMSTRTIGFIAAMPEEIASFLLLAAPLARERTEGFTIYRGAIGGQSICLILSGIGRENAAAATRALIAAACPDIIISFGFAGAVAPGLAVGDIVVAGRLLHHHDRLFAKQRGVAPKQAKLLAFTLAESCRDNNFHVSCGTFVTTDQVLTKQSLARQLPAGVLHPVVEMETAAVAQVAVLAGIPLVAIRGISDGSGEEIGFDITEFTDKKMRIRLWRVLWTVLKKPWLVPQLLRLAGNAKIAGKNLAVVMPVLMENL